MNHGNILIAMNPGDTLDQVNAVLRFIYESRPLDGIVPDEAYEWGRSQVLMACHEALEAARDMLENEYATPAPVSIRRAAGGGK